MKKDHVAGQNLFEMIGYHSGHRRRALPCGKGRSDLHHYYFDWQTRNFGDDERIGMIFFV